MFHVAVKADSVYTCVPENTFGSGDKGNITIIVRDPALIESAPVDQVVLEKDNVTLYCNATGNPTPNIT